MNKSNIVSIIKTIIVLFLLMNLMIMVKVYYSSIKEFKQAEAAFAEKDLTEAVRHYERAIIWYYPVITPLQKSIGRMREIAREHEKNEDIKTAIKTYRRLKAALYSINSTYSPAKQQIRETEEAILSLQSPEIASLKRLPSPWEKVHKNSLWALLAGVGLIGWIATTIIFIINWGKLEKETAGTRKIFFAVSMIALFYALWLIGLHNA